ncbi:MAG: GNAT family N-acetyltransferase [Halopseudomonas aestusnigri]
MVKVKEAGLEDIDIVYDLIKAIAKHHDQEQFVTSTKAELENSGFSDVPKFGVLLAEIDSQIAGFASYTWNYSIWSGSSYMNIDDVFVWEEYRGQKVGEALMKNARTLCEKRGVKSIKWEVEEDNIKAIKFYKRLGAEVDIKGICRWSLASPL